jgi:hypothetical protein
MKTIFSLLMLASLTAAFSQAPTIQWQKSLGGSSDEFALSVIPTFDGGYIAAGYSTSNDGDVTWNHGGKDYWIVKTDLSGNILWQQSYGGTLDDIPTTICQTNDSGYIVAGYSRSNNGDVTGHRGGADTTDVWVLKLTSTGGIQWQKSLGGTDDDVANTIIQTTDSGYIVAGFTVSADVDVSMNHGTADGWIVKLNPFGNIQWEKSFGGTSYDYVYSICQTHDDGFIAAAATYSNDADVSFNHGLTDIWLIKIDPAGNLEWEKSLGGSNVEVPSTILETAGNGFIISAYTYSADGDVSPHLAPPEYWIVKTDSAGTIQWQKTFGGQSGDEALSIGKTADGGYVVAGRSGSMDGDVTGNHGVWDCWIVKLNDLGIIQWQQCYGGPWDEGAAAVSETSDGGFIIGGHAMLDGGDVTGNHGGHDFWIIKLTGTVGINENTERNKLTVLPNPATSHIFIVSDYFMGTPWTINDLTGREIQNGIITGPSEMIDISRLTPGIYLLQAGGKGQWIKFIKQ